MKTLVIGKGHLGHLLKQELNVPDELFWTDRIAKLDEKTLGELQPECVINTAAKTDLTYCEQNKEECWSSNVVDPLNLFRRIVKINSQTRFVHISSGCIWNGPYNEKGEPFKPNDPPTPACFYSWSKASFDALIKDESRHHSVIILRPRQVYSEDNTARNTLKKLNSYKSLIDTPNSMTSAYTIVKTIQALKEWEFAGYNVFNVYDTGITTPYKVGCLLAEAGLREKPEMTQKADLDKWHKPQRVDAVLYDDLFERLVDPPNVEDELKRVIELFKAKAS